jgi:pimeloyl-ACP methyl ester carboxylesterase
VITIGRRQFAVECAGAATGPVIMVAASGSDMGEWSAVEKEVFKFAKFCVYEPPGSDRPRSIDAMVTDLDGIVREVAGPAPVVLVGYSLGGILARRYAAQFRSRVAGFVFIESAHEEQLWRFGAIAPSLLDAQFGRSWHDPGMGRAMGMLARDQRLMWDTDRPLVVVVHGVPEAPPPSTGVTPAQAKRLEAEWQNLQQDLARRSPRGELRKVPATGPRMRQQQAAVLAAIIREVWEKSR